MNTNRDTHRWALLWVAFGASLWGADTVLRRPLTTVLSSTQIVFCEHLILALILLPAFWRARGEWRALRPLEWGAVLGIAWGGSALGGICFTQAVKIGHPTAAVFLQKLQPLFTTLLARLLLREPLSRPFWMYLVVAVAGGYLVSFGFASPVSLARVNAAAALLALAAAALWGACTVLGRFALASVSFLTLTVLRIVCAAPLLAALAWRDSASLETQLHTRQVISLLFIALVPGLAGLLIYYRGLRHTRASLAALAELSFPATAALLNWIFLAAPVGAAQLAGFALVWGAILGLARSARSPQSHA